MIISKAHRSVCLSLLALAACGGNVDRAEETESLSSPLLVVPIHLPPHPIVLCTVPAITEYTIPTANSSPQSIVTGPDGNLWFTEWSGEKVGSFSPTTSTFNEFPVSANSGPVGIAVGPDGNIWFSEMLSSRIGQMTTAGVLLNQFPNPSNWASGADDPNYITTGPNGNLWFSGYAIGQISTSGTETGMATPTSVVGSLGIVTGPDQNVWFVHQWDGPGPATGAVVQVTASGTMTTYNLPPAVAGANAMPWGITAGPDGNLWAVGNNVWKISTTGQVLGTYALSGLPANDYYPAGIATGSDGNLWFTEFATNRIGRITTSGAISEWTLGGDAGVVGPNSITAGPDGALWFTEEKANKIGRITTSVCHVEEI